MEVRIVRHLRDIDANDWNALTGEDDPFVEHAFLSALEESGSVGSEAGVLPLHVTLHRNGELIAALPLYLKMHSWGEFIFDFQWAHAAERAGIRYYPKLTSMVPYTPATGRRLLVKDGISIEEVVPTLVSSLHELTKECQASSAHVLFLNEAEERSLESAGMLSRHSMQFHWQNRGWTSFEHYLSDFRAERRKQVKRERREATASGIQIELKSGAELNDEEWSALDRVYRLNCARHGSQPYLTTEFFPVIRNTCPERLLAVLASREGRVVAASINFTKGRHLYGRYWGALEDVEFLHFEVCYYRLIEHAIERGITRFEAGAQGEHKLKRGLLPVRIRSAHWMRDRRLDAAIRNYLPQERAAVEREIAELMESSPFKD